MAATELTKEFASVYGPVVSWRYGRSLGIDPIGKTSVCSFNCVYCQLGEIEIVTGDRAIYVPTETILQDLQKFAPWDVDIVTLSGSGEPTLALNLKEILQGIKHMTGKPTLVLTNGTLLDNPQVREDLSLTDRVSVKLDAISERPLNGVNRPVEGLDLNQMWAGILEFRRHYSGDIGVQTMILSRWTRENQDRYIEMMAELSPVEIQLNTPSRPKPVKRQLDGRGNHYDDRPYEIQQLKCVDVEVLQEFGDRIQAQTGIPVRYRG